GGPGPAAATDPGAPGGAPGTRWQELLQGIYRRRTLVVWTIWFTTYFAAYGLTTWLPSLYSSVFRLPLEESLRYSLIPSGLSIVGAIVCALLIDRTGRKLWIAASLLVGAVLLLVLWQLGATSPMQLVIFASAGALAINTVAGALYLYSPELYPTRMRALASSVGSAWLRIASAIGPAVMGFVVAGYPLATAFLLFGIVLLIGAVITGLFAVETSNRVLEEVSP